MYRTHLRIDRGLYLNYIFYFEGSTTKPELKHSISLPVPGSTATVLPPPPPPSQSGVPAPPTTATVPATLSRREQLFGHLVSGNVHKLKTRHDKKFSFKHLLSPT